MKASALKADEERGQQILLVLMQHQLGNQAQATQM